jgi:hypothetical protein
MIMNGKNVFDVSDLYIIHVIISFTSSASQYSTVQYCNTVVDH